MYSVVSLIPFLLFLVWIGSIIFLIVLATRLVNAVEQIARVLRQRLPDSTKP